jgi:hypothetical protein
MKNFKTNVFLKKPTSGSISYGTCEQKTAFSAIFKPKSSGNRPFRCHFFEYFGRQGAFLPPLTLSTATPAGALPPPPNSQRTKQFLSRFMGSSSFIF